jgi:hypothetical protein
MPYRIGDALFCGWESIEIEPGEFAEVFVFPVQYNAGLMPGDYGQAIRNLAPTVNRLRRGRSAIWVRLDSPENLWFFRELRAGLKGIPISIAVTIGDRKPALNDFSFRPWTDDRPQAVVPPFIPPLPRQGITDEALTCLRILARLGDAFTAEVASLSGLEMVATAEESLKLLSDQGLVEHIVDDKTRRFPYWEIRKPGKSLALRSWGIPPGFVFTNYRERMDAPEGDHRRRSRLWPAWLRSVGWKDRVEIYSGWSEAHLVGEKTRPDAICWGTFDGLETLFWLEVESGHSSRVNIQAKIARRMRVAASYAFDRKVNLVFCVLGMHWVTETAALAFAGLLQNWTSAILGNWTTFGRLPIPIWGRVQTDT